MRSDIKKAVGLGASGDGSHHWWVQRVSALLLIPLTLWLAFCLLQAMFMDIDEARIWLAQPFTAVALALFVLVALYHGQLGMQVVIEDYISHKGWRIAIILFFKGLCLVAACAAIFSILRVAL